jgi:hypothetical protein
MVPISYVHPEVTAILYSLSQLSLLYEKTTALPIENSTGSLIICHMCFHTRNSQVFLSSPVNEALDPVYNAISHLLYS